MKKLLSLIFGTLLLLQGTTFAYEFPLIRLKPGGEFTNYNYIVDDDSYTRVINFDNVTSLREAGKGGILVVDGNMNINFESGLTRREFIEAYTKYIDSKNDKQVKDNELKTTEYAEQSLLYKIGWWSSLIGLGCVLGFGTAKFVLPLEK